MPNPRGHTPQVGLTLAIVLQARMLTHSGQQGTKYTPVINLLHTLLD